jgi:hypothetical protein
MSGPSSRTANLAIGRRLPLRIANFVFGSTMRFPPDLGTFARNVGDGFGPEEFRTMFYFDENGEHVEMGD